MIVAVGTSWPTILEAFKMFQSFTLRCFIVSPCQMLLNSTAGRRIVNILACLAAPVSECGEFSMEGWRGLPTATQATLKGLIPNPLIYYSACVVVTAPSYGHTGRKLKTSSVPYVPTAHSVVAGPSYIHPHGQH